MSLVVYTIHSSSLLHCHRIGRQRCSPRYLPTLHTNCLASLQRYSPYSPPQYLHYPCQRDHTSHTHKKPHPSVHVILLLLCRLAVLGVLTSSGFLFSVLPLDTVLDSQVPEFWQHIFIIFDICAFFGCLV